MPTQRDPVGLGRHARGPLHHQGHLEGGGWLGQGQKVTVSHCRGLGWRSEVRTGVSPDSWDSGAPGHKKAHRSRPPCRRDPGKAGGWAGRYGPSLSLSSYLQPMPAWTPNLLLFPKPLFPGTPMVLSPTEPHFALHTAGPLDQKHHLVTEALLIHLKLQTPVTFHACFCFNFLYSTFYLKDHMIYLFTFFTVYLPH